MFESINIEVIDECNLSCEYCYKKNDFINNSGNIGKTKNLLAISQSTDIKTVVITGGEPTLNSKLDEIFDIMKYKEIFVLTNGLCYDSRIKDKNLVVSIDGKEIENQMARNITSNQYKKILENIIEYNKTCKSLKLHTVVNKYNFKSINVSNTLAGFRRTIGLVSDITNSKLGLSQNDIEQLLLKVSELYASSSYHAMLTHQIMRKSSFYYRYSDKYPFRMFPIYNLNKDEFMLGNKTYRTLDELQRCYINETTDIWNQLKEVIEKMSDDFYFDPYIEIERFLKQKN